MKAIERIYQYIDYMGIRPAELERICGISNGYLSKQFNRKADIGESILCSIIENCPKLNPSWLLIGEEPMLREEVPKEVPLQVPQQANTEIIQILISKIEQQAEEIGKLKERLLVFETGKGHMKGVGDADVAAVG